MDSLAHEICIFPWEYLHVLPFSAVGRRFLRLLPLTSCKVPTIFESSFRTRIGHGTGARTRALTELYAGRCMKAVGERGSFVELSDSPDKLQDLLVSVVVHLIRLVASKVILADLESKFP